MGTLFEMDLKKESDHILYEKKKGTCDIHIFTIYVDDLIFTGNNEK